MLIPCLEQASEIGSITSSTTPRILDYHFTMKMPSAMESGLKAR